MRVKKISIASLPFKEVPQASSFKNKTILVEQAPCMRPIRAPIIHLFYGVQGYVLFLKTKIIIIL